MALVSRNSIMKIESPNGAVADSVRRRAARRRGACSEYSGPVTLTAVDLFAGAGGATQGLRDAGFDVRVAVENDETAAKTWKLNHPGVMICDDVRQVTATAILNAAKVEKGELTLLKACPPCQGFSTLRGKRSPDEARNDLVLDTLRLVRQIEPAAVLLENVPGLRRDARFEVVISEMHDLGYAVSDYLVDAQALGVPQRRRRLVVLAIRDGACAPPNLGELIPQGLRRPSMTAGEALSGMDSSSLATDDVHVWRSQRGSTASRLAAIPVGGTRFDLPEALQLECHKRLNERSGGSSRNAGGSYGRVRLGEAAPTMTTRCTTPACGSFIHPSENRGLSLREAATFQTFPQDYRWAGNYGEIERQIGNAVPVWMAEAFGLAALRSLEALPASL